MGFSKIFSTITGKNKKDSEPKQPKRSEGIIIENEIDSSTKTYKYRLVFHNLTEEQAVYIIKRLHDYSWEKGLAIAECRIDHTPGQITIFDFTSTKHFTTEEAPEDQKKTELFTNNNIYNTLTGKGNFFGEMYYSEEMGQYTSDILFIDDAGNTWQVELGKYPDLTKKESQ